MVLFGVMLGGYDEGKDETCSPHISLNMRLDPSLQQSTLRDLGVVLSDILHKPFPGIHCNQQTYKRNTADSQVKRKLNICGVPAGAAATELSEEEANAYWGPRVLLKQEPTQ